MERSVLLSDAGNRTKGGAMKTIALVVLVVAFALLTGCCMLHPM
ncbi:hypothetical protein [Geomonas subterranea]|nr:MULTISPECIES: hypothetical protein [Geomonas]